MPPANRNFTLKIPPWVDLADRELVARAPAASTTSASVLGRGERRRVVVRSPQKRVVAAGFTNRLRFERSAVSGAGATDDPPAVQPGTNVSGNFSDDPTGAINTHTVLGSLNHAKGREELAKAHAHSKTAHDHSEMAHGKSQSHK